MTGYRYPADKIKTITIDNLATGETEVKVDGKKISEPTDRTLEIVLGPDAVTITRR